MNYVSLLLIINVGYVFTMCSHIFTLFWSRKTYVIVETFQLASMCLYVPSIRRSLHFFSKSYFFFYLLLCFIYNLYHMHHHLCGLVSVVPLSQQVCMYFLLINKGLYEVKRSHLLCIELLNISRFCLEISLLFIGKSNPLFIPIFSISLYILTMIRQSES